MARHLSNKYQRNIQTKKNLRASITALSAHALRNREISETHALRAELKRLRLSRVSDHNHPDSNSFNAINCRRLYVLPGISAECADTLIRSLQPRTVFDEGEGVTTEIF